MSGLPDAEALTFAPLAPEWLDACAEIARYAPDAWSRENLEKSLPGPQWKSFVALQGNAPVGFACFLQVAETADLEMTAVHPGARRRGVAAALLRHAFAALAANGAQRVLLEVRQSNAPAIALYQQLGFSLLVRRPGMYQTPKEDGLLMAKALP